jgi:hypothetical protein
VRPSAHPSEEHFRSWLIGFGTGCPFAVKLAADARVNVYANGPTFARSDLAIIDGFVESCAAADEVAAVLFPSVRSANGLARVLGTLGSGDRWTVGRIPWRGHERRDSALLKITWRNATGLECSVMGFAPLGCMPATRRAPYFGLALWGGLHANEHRKKRDEEIGFINIRSGYDADAHRVKLKQATERVTAILVDPPEDIEHLRDVAFVVPKRVVDVALRR